ncbi:MAG TPA: hypothetical protein VGP72_06285 [Planctomycetota bacterium]
MKRASWLVFSLALAFSSGFNLQAGDGEHGKHRERAARDGDKEVKPEHAELKAALDDEIKSLDADKDGKVDHGEGHAALKKLRAKLDADGDGKIDHGELRKLKENHPLMYERVMKRIREHREKLAGAREAKEERRESKTPETAGDREKRREGYVDGREQHQQKRIDHGIAKGYLTPDETAKLQSMEKNIADTEASFKSDGKLSKDETKQLRGMLDQASVQIWAQKHDTEGNQMPTYRLGKNVFARDEFTSQLEAGDMTGSQARALLKEFREAAAAKRRLSNDDLSADERAKLQGVYNDFLNKHFEVR